MVGQFFQIAKQFAAALDAEDYPAATALFDPECEYLCRGQVFHGPKAIIGSYQSTGDSTQEKFDRVEYESAVETLDDRSMLIQFQDRLSHKGQSHTFECQQLVELNTQGLIVKIEHRDLPGQREGLNAFLYRVGLVVRDTCDRE